MDCPQPWPLRVGLAKADIPHGLMSKWWQALPTASLGLLGDGPSDPLGQAILGPTTFHLDYLIKKQ